MLGWCQQTFCFKSLSKTHSIVLPLHLEQIFLPIIWISTEGEGDEIEIRDAFNRPFHHRLHLFKVHIFREGLKNLNKSPDLLQNPHWILAIPIHAIQESLVSLFGRVVRQCLNVDYVLMEWLGMVWIVPIQIRVGPIHACLQNQCAAHQFLR